MGRKGALAVLGFLIAAGCGSTGLLYDESEALRAASSPAGAGFLGLLPAKKEGPADPGEVREGELKKRWGFQIGFSVFGGEVDYYEDYPTVRGLFRLGADRVNPLGLELSVAYQEMPGAEMGGEEIDTSARNLFFRARGLFGVGSQRFYPSVGMQLVIENVEYGDESETHLGATLDFGLNVRTGGPLEFDFSTMVLLGSENAKVGFESMVGVAF